MNILITGASGFIGRHVTSHCLEQGHNVTVCVRDVHWMQRYFPMIKTIPVDFTKDYDTETWLSRLDNIDVVINCVGIIQKNGKQTFENLHTKTPCALFSACQARRIKKVIQISALGADDTAFSQYHLSKKAADDHLSSLDISWTILKPSLVYGHGAKSMTFFKALAALPFTPLVGSGNQLIQPVHISDLCHTIDKALDTDHLSHKRIEVVGSEPVTIRTIYTHLTSWLGLKHTLFLPIPYWLILRVARLGEFVGNTPISREAIQMLEKGNTGDVGAFSKATGIKPRSFENTLMSSPPLPSEIAHSKQLFLFPLLRISLALLWIITGYVSAFVYPVEQSFSMLAKVGVLAPIALYSAAALDLILGIALLINYQIRLVVAIQIALIISYSLIITIGMPELWAYPFGSVTKNIPLIISTLFLLTETRK